MTWKEASVLDDGAPIALSSGERGFVIERLPSTMELRVALYQTDVVVRVFVASLEWRSNGEIQERRGFATWRPAAGR